MVMDIDIGKWSKICYTETKPTVGRLPHTITHRNKLLYFRTRRGFGDKARISANDKKTFYKTIHHVCSKSSEEDKL